MLVVCLDPQDPPSISPRRLTFDIVDDHTEGRVVSEGMFMGRRRTGLVRATRRIAESSRSRP